MKCKSLFFTIFAFIFTGCFLQKKDAYNLLIRRDEERPEYMQQLAGRWENGENSVSLTGSRISLFCADNGRNWYSASGLFTADDKNLYVSTQDSSYLDVMYDSSELVFPYTLSEMDGDFELTLTVAEKVFTFEKSSFFLLPVRRQSTLNGEWKSEKPWKKPSDWNITLRFVEESFLVTIGDSSFSYSLLGDVFYEGGMMFITKVWDMETESEPKKTDFGEEFITDAYDYAAYHGLPEYVFFGARLDTPYHSICNYKLNNDALTIMAYDKEIILYRQDSK